MIVAEMIASCLVAAQFPNVFPKTLPSAVDFPEAIVLVQGKFGRESRIEGEERGTLPVTVYVVRDLPAEAESVAIDVEKCIRRASWETFSESGPWRIAGLDTSAPSFNERDSSGRYVWQFEVTVTAVRSV